MCMRFTCSKIARSSLLALIVALVGFGVVQGAGARAHKQPKKPQGHAYNILVVLKHGELYDTDVTVTDSQCTASQDETDSFNSSTSYTGRSGPQPDAFELNGKGKLIGSPQPVGEVGGAGDFKVDGTAKGANCFLPPEQLCFGDLDFLDKGPDDTYAPALAVFESDKELHFYIDTVRGLRFTNVDGNGDATEVSACQTAFDGRNAFARAIQRDLMFTSGHEHNMFTVRQAIPSSDLLKLKVGQPRKFDISSDDGADVAKRVKKDCSPPDEPEERCTMRVHWHGFVQFMRIH
jgi:hypothetical protein